jgi:uncharacterized membrane protein YkoI
MKYTIFLIALSAFAAEKKVKLEDLPAAVQQAVKQESQGATVRGFSQETEKGKTLYEAEFTVNGHAKDVSFDPTGKIVSVEEEVAIDSIPAAAREAIQKAATGGKLGKVEQVVENGKTSFEATITKGGKHSEFACDAAGKPVK